MTKITVITVVRNGEKTLEPTMLSVLNQTYGSIEYIVVDGASTDGTVGIIKRYDERIKNGEFPNIMFRWMSEPDKGIYDAMNKGIDLATGEWINFMNSNDIFYNEFVLKTLFDDKKYLPEISLLYGHTLLQNSKRLYLQKTKLISAKDPMPFCHQAVFVRTATMQEMKFDTNYKIMADRGLFYRLYFAGSKGHYVDAAISVVQKYGYSNRSITKSRTELNAILRSYSMITPLMATLYLIYAAVKDFTNKCWRKICKKNLT
ncbi:MAG: glycosyltransferase [Prevotellaceae bacterium]|jgi:glycosyltransferase involved in cell wall biosynthesis|nr:glycosyltransferase [Prevotellaceae bacterium]